MNKKILIISTIILIALVLELHFKVFSSAITGLYSAILSLAISSVTDGTISYFSYPLIVNKYEEANFFVEFRNIGSMNLTEKIEIHVNNSNHQTIASYYDDNVTLVAGASREFNATFTPNRTGIYYVFVRVPYDNKTAETSKRFRVVPEESTKETTSVAFIQANEIGVFNYVNPELDVTNISINTSNLVSNARVAAAKLDVLPSDVSEVPPGIVNRYLAVETSINESNIAKAKIKFKIEKSWITIKDADSDLISLYRYDSQWERLPTTKISEDASYFYYEAESSGLSVFAISTRERVVVVERPIGVGAAPSPPAGPTLVNLTLEYPEKITLNQGETSIIYLRIKNTGNVNLNNIILTTFSTLPIKIPTTSLAGLSPDSSFIFFISVEVPKEIELDTYPIDFTLASNRITKKGQILAEVKLLRIEFEVNQTIKNYEYLIEKLAEEIDIATKEGRNTVLALESLDIARKELDTAKQLYEAGNYEKAKEQLEKVKQKIEDTATELAKTLPRITFVPFPLPRPEIVGGITIGLGTPFALYYRRKSEDKKYRKSISYAIRIIKNRGSVWER
jgi:PGF-pre-PGF domain-containing protein